MHNVFSDIPSVLSLVCEIHSPSKIFPPVQAWNLPYCIRAGTHSAFIRLLFVIFLTPRSIVLTVFIGQEFPDHPARPHGTITILTRRASHFSHFLKVDVKIATTNTELYKTVICLGVSFRSRCQYFSVFCIPTVLPLPVFRFWLLIFWFQLAITETIGF